MKEIVWNNDNEFTMDGVDFYCTMDDYSLKTDDNRVILLKNKAVLDNYLTVFSSNPPKNILEFGIWEGGSPAIFSLMFEVDRFVGVDLRPPVEGFESFINRHQLKERIKIYYEVSQTDRGKVENIIDAEFSDTPLDVIIDDASHQYELTKKTFEIAFPYLKPSGTYVIEDWGWAHWDWDDKGQFDGQTALSYLIFELAMVCASRQEIISEVRVLPAFTFITKSKWAGYREDFSLSGLYRMHGMEMYRYSSVTKKDLEEQLDTLKRGEAGKVGHFLKKIKETILGS